ncbi:hypothetical protein ACP275_10G183900 [Erythranthe tilingii]
MDIVMDIVVKILGGAGNLLGNFAVNTTSKLVEKLVEAKVELEVEKKKGELEVQKRKGENSSDQTFVMVLVGVSISFSAANAVWNFVFGRQRPGVAPLPEETRNVNIQITLPRPPAPLPPPPPPPPSTKKLKIREIGGANADDEIYQTIPITDPVLLRAFMDKVMAIVKTSQDAASGEITVADEVIDASMIQILNEFLTILQNGGDDA